MPLASADFEFESPDLTPPGDLAKGRRIPAWVMSAALHTVLLVTLALVVQIAPRGNSIEPSRHVGVVLARAQQGQTQYFDQAASSQSTASAASSVSPAANPLPTPQELPLDAGGVLPSADELLGSSSAGEFLPDAGDLTAGGGAAKRFGGQVSTQVYGLQAEGTKFLYVFDRSGSMSGYNGRPLRSAQRELIASLSDLERTHQFQIIFYNERPQVFQPDGRTPRLVYGDEQGKALASRFVRSIIADGGTRHLEPILMALAMRPDVIFFLTDAEEPRLSADELLRIRRANKGTQIHAIEFGFGPGSSDDNFLKRLARENGGQHAYVDISKLPE